MAAGITDYQAKYFAYELTRRAPAGSVDRLSTAVAGATVDLNPHQVELSINMAGQTLDGAVVVLDGRFSCQIAATEGRNYAVPSVITRS